MTTKKVYRVIGLMSGTSLDGIDVALIETDGAAHVKPLGFQTIPYKDADRAIIRKAYGLKDRGNPLVQEAEALSTRLHIEAIRAFDVPDVDLIGYHGQTIYHAPQDGVTLQIGDGEKMARALGIPVVYDFRSADVHAGGEGAPLAPLYHQALVQSARADLPAAILNIGGVANVSYIGPPTRHCEDAQQTKQSIASHENGLPRPTHEGLAMTEKGESRKAEILAFDTGPGNALMDDWVQKRTGARYDENGALAAQGKPMEDLLKDWLAHPYFSRPPPKSLDRDEWDIAVLGPLVQKMAEISAEDGAATLMEFTARSIIDAVRFMPQAPKSWYVCGGGAQNKALMSRLARDLQHIHPIDRLGFNGDAIEAECFAYLAVRSLKGLPISLPTTTGAEKPLTGGRFAKAS